jgi:RNA-directed DNA polymerase
MEAVKFFPGKDIIKKWLKPGIMEDGIVLDSTGTPQGSIVSLLLCNIALHGLEKEIFVKRRTKEYVEGPRLRVRYADDFVVLCTDYSTAYNTLTDVQLAINKRGLEI